MNAKPNPLKPNPSLLAAQARFRRDNLPFPPIPDALAAQLRMRSTWHFSSRADLPRLYEYATYLDEFTHKPVVDYVALGHDGHGVNSYALHYYLAYRSLRALLQLQWGGAFTDNDAAGQRIGTVFDLLAGLIAQAEQTAVGTSKVLVAASDFAGVGLFRLNGAGDQISSQKLSLATDRSILLQARDVLATL